jgi:hypothetical protein
MQSPQPALLALLYTARADLSIIFAVLLLWCAGVPGPVWLPTLIGAAIGGVFAAFHRYCSARMWRPPNSPLNILVTGEQRLPWRVVGVV